MTDRKNAIGCGYSSQEQERAARTYAHATAWKVSHPYEWSLILQRVEQAASLNKRVSVAKVSRGLMPASYAPIVARWIVKDHPAFAPMIVVERSVYDLF